MFMADTLTKDKLTSSIKTFFETKGFICNIYIDKIEIKKDAIVSTILFDDDDINTELSNVTKAQGNFVVLNENTLQFVLVSKKTIEETIHLGGVYNGSIAKLAENMYAIITQNISLLDVSKISISGEYELKDLLKEDLYICEIILPNIRVTEDNVKKIKTSIIMDILYHRLINFTLLENKDIMNTLDIKTNEDINTIIYSDEVPLEYFILAEKIEFVNFKYLEYYHVIEYYFMIFSKKKIAIIMSDLITNTFLKNKKLDDDFLYDTYKNFMNPHRVNNDDFKEHTQLLELFKSLNYDLTVDAINSSSLSDVDFLLKDLNQVKNTKIIVFNCFNSNKTKKKLLRSCTDEEKESFMIALAERIYKIRNYIVHTKKGELNSAVFHPSHDNLKELNKDVLLIRELSRVILIKAAITP
jgi:hypothetical protein